MAFYDPIQPVPRELVKDDEPNFVEQRQWFEYIRDRCNQVPKSALTVYLTGIGVPAAASNCISSKKYLGALPSPDNCLTLKASKVVDAEVEPRSVKGIVNL